MTKTLSQEEINALLRAARVEAAAAKGTASTPQFIPFVFGKASPISKQQIHDVAQTHEAFTYNLKNRLAAYLQVTVEVNPMSVDEVPYSEFIQSLPPPSYIASIRCDPTSSLAILSLDLPVAFSMVDLMLGGDGKAEPPQRPTTEIEEKVLQIALDIICEELQTAWRQIVEIGFTFDQTQRLSDLFRLMPPYERVLFLSFEVRMPEVFSTLSVAFPATASSLLLRRLGKKGPRNRGSTAESITHIRERLQNAVFGVEMMLPPARIRGKALLDLTPGQTILIQHRINQPALLNVAGSRMFSGFPARTGTQRSAVIHQTFAAQRAAGRYEP
ncbi:MAG: flagellar motor switch protein FliM [Terriglobia bacterium]